MEGIYEGLGTAQAKNYTASRELTMRFDKRGLQEFGESLVYGKRAMYVVSELKRLSDEESARIQYLKSGLLDPAGEAESPE